MRPANLVRRRKPTRSTQHAAQHATQARHRRDYSNMFSARACARVHARHRRTYFSGMKLRWMLDNVPAVSEGAANGTALFGTIESWLIWNLSGGVEGGLHVSDVSNASRTMLMDLASCSWHKETCDTLEIPMGMLPKIVSNSEVYCKLTSGALAGVPIAGALGDQQAATLGQACFEAGQAKNTYGTGCFMLMTTGQGKQASQPAQAIPAWLIQRDKNRCRSALIDGRNAMPCECELTAPSVSMCCVAHTLHIYRQPNALRERSPLHGWFSAGSRSACDILSRRLCSDRRGRCAMAQG